MQLLRNINTLKASSIVESVLAISIISVCVLVAFMVYLNVIMQNNSVNYFKAKHKIDLLIQESIEQNNYDDNLYAFDGYTISKKVKIRKLEHTAFFVFNIKTGEKSYIVNELIPYKSE